MLLITFFIISNFICQKNIVAQNDVSDMTRLPVFNDWQVKIGYSVNNTNILNVEGGYLIPLSKIFALSLDTRIYSFASISPSIITKPIAITKKFSLSLKTGLGFILFGPVVGLGDIAFEFGGLIRYRISRDYSIILEYKQISKNSAYVSFETLPPKQTISNFPIRFISIGIEF